MKNITLPIMIKKILPIACFVFITGSIKAQGNIFAPENVKAITTNPEPIGDINRINNGNAEQFDFVDFFTSESVDITFELVTGKKVTNYSVYFYAPYYGADTIELQGSIDGTDWVVLEKKQSGVYIFSSSIDNNTAYKYYKFIFKGIPSGNLSPVEIEAGDGILSAPVLQKSGALGSEISFQWNQVFMPGNRSNGTYEIQRSLDGTNFSLLQSVSGTTTSYTDAGLQRNTQYWYMIRALLDGNATAFSQPVIFSTDDDTIREAPGLNITQVFGISNIAACEWYSTVFGGPGGFRLEKSLDNINFSLVGVFPKTTTDYMDSSVRHSKTYWYRIQSFNDISTSPYSVAKKFESINDSLLSAPTLEVSSPTGVQVELRWSTMPFSPLDVATINMKGHYQIEQSTDSINFSVIGLTGRVGPAITSYTDEAVSPNTSYWYRIKAINYLGESPYSTVLKVTTNNIAAIPKDITDDGGKLYVSAENKSGGLSSADNNEGSSKFIDNSLYTKWLVFNGETSNILSAIYKPTQQYLITGYSISTAEDAPSRDPRNWKFYGSKDSTTWIELDAQTDKLGEPTPRTTTFTFPLAAIDTNKFVYYRIEFTANNFPFDGVRYQVAEWEIFGIPEGLPSIPDSLAVTNITSSSISLKWKKDIAGTSTKYVLQRSIDGLYFNSIDTIAATATTYIDSKVVDSTTYFYRLQALDASGLKASGWSKPARGTTAFVAGVPLTPISFRSVFIGDTMVNFIWTDRSYNETGFEIERSADTVNFKLLKVLPANQTSFGDSLLWPATQYYYRIRAINSQGKSAYSSPLGIFTTGANSPPIVTNPIVPPILCSGKGSYQFSLSGVLGGLGSEANQAVKVIGVRANSDETDSTSKNFVTGFNFNPTIVNGNVTYSFSTTGAAMAGDSAIILVTLQDNGGTNSFGVDTVNVPVKFYFQPLTVQIQSNKDSLVPRNILVTLTANSNFPTSTSYSWANADGIEGGTNQTILWVRPTRATTYTVTASNAGGCTATKSITIAPNVDDIIVNNVLTPNGDGKNDRWIIWGLEKYPNNTVKVFDRLGRPVLIQKNYSNNWDGRVNGHVLDEGAYYFVVEPGNGKKVMSGTINIVH